MEPRYLFLYVIDGHVQVDLMCVQFGPIGIALDGWLKYIF